MTEPDYDDPAVEAHWCEERHVEVVDYLRRQKVMHGRVGDWPAWHIAPYVSIWAIESATRPEWVGWWVICGDLPTDYISAATIKHPRDAMRAIAQRWLDLAFRMERGESHLTMQVGSPDNQAELAPLLEKRGALLLKWSDDDSYWGPEYD